MLPFGHNLKVRKSKGHITQAFCLKSATLGVVRNYVYIVINMPYTAC